MIASRSGSDRAPPHLALKVHRVSAGLRIGPLGDFITFAELAVADRATVEGQNGSDAFLFSCLLLPSKQTFSGAVCMSASGQEATSGRYSITSSASTSRLCGMVRPSALAVLRLITRSNLVGCSTGISPGFVPCRSDQQSRLRGGKEPESLVRNRTPRSAKLLAPV